MVSVIEAYRQDLQAARGALAKGHYRDGAALLQKYVDWPTKDSDYLVTFATLLQKDGEFGRSDALWSRLAAIDPTHPAIPEGQAVCLYGLGRRSEAVALMRRERLVHPNNPSVLLRLLQQLLTTEGLSAAMAELRSERDRRGSLKGLEPVIDSLRQKALGLFDPDEIRAADRDDMMSIEAPPLDASYRLKAIYARFEPCGANCEFGEVQRKHGCEPLSLLRWTAVTPDALVRMLTSRFEGYERPDIYDLLFPMGGEYHLRDSLYGTIGHTGVNRSDLPADEFLARAARRQGFLKRKFLDDAAQGDKVFVYKANAPLSEAEVAEMDAALLGLGVTKRLFVQPAGEHPRGGETDIAVPGGRVMGYLSTIMPDIRFDEWDRIVVAAHDHFART